MWWWCEGNVWFSAKKNIMSYHFGLLIFGALTPSKSTKKKRAATTVVIYVDFSSVFYFLFHHLLRFRIKILVRSHRRNQCLSSPRVLRFTRRDRRPTSHNTVLLPLRKWKLQIKNKSRRRWKCHKDIFTHTRRMWEYYRILLLLQHRRRNG